MRDRLRKKILKMFSEKYKTFVCTNEKSKSANKFPKQTLYVLDKISMVHLEKEKVTIYLFDMDVTHAFSNEKDAKECFEQIRELLNQ